jgi:predicted outer membrane repeat protein
MVIADHVTIDGNSADHYGGGIAVSGPGASLDMTDCVVTNNYMTAIGGNGGGIANLYGTAKVSRSTITGNSADPAAAAGGGIWTGTTGTFELELSRVSGNSANIYGGGIASEQGDTTISHSIIRDNTLSYWMGEGGGIYADQGDLGITASEISGNTAAGSGGGIYSSSVVNLENTTISGNSAPEGGAMWVSGPDISNLLNSTIAENMDPSGTGVGGIYASSPLWFKHTIVAGNQSDQCMDVGGTNITSLGYNIEDTNTCGFSATGDQPNTDPLLGPLGFHGGESATWTHLLLPGSPAVDGGSNIGCPATDQRDVPRPINGDQIGLALCDVGAVEAKLHLYLPLINR